MANKNEVRLTFAGDAGDLEKAAARAERSLQDVGGAADKAAVDMRSAATKIDAGFQGLGDTVDSTEQRILGVRDIIDGTAAIMEGPGEAGLSAYLQGWADLASGIVNAALPALQSVTKGMVTQVKTMAATTAATVANVAKQVAQWIVLGAQSTVQAAKVAAAWLISMGPIAIVAAAVVALVVLIVKNWDTIEAVIRGAGERIVSWAQGAWSAITELLAGPIRRAGELISSMADAWVTIYIGIPRRIASALGSIFEIVTAPFRAAMNWVVDRWNNFELSLGPVSIAGQELFGGFTLSTPNLPRFAAGGIVPGPAGMAVPILAHGGERILPRGSAAFGGNGATTINLTVQALDPRQAATLVVEALEDFRRDSGAARIQQIVA